jgi:pyruvate/2-oxoglutarate dehydrogenase complex dihydrolipoamide dehydrogenase (E3) component
MVRGLNEMYLENYRNTGAEFILGTGRFARKTAEVTLPDGTIRQMRGADVIVRTGTRAIGTRYQMAGFRDLVFQRSSGLRH